MGGRRNLKTRILQVVNAIHCLHKELNDEGGLSKLYRCNLSQTYYELLRGPKL